MHSGGLQRLQPVAETCVNWHKHARLLAAQVTHPPSRWRATATITPDGEIHLRRGRWRASLIHEATD